MLRGHATGRRGARNVRLQRSKIGIDEGHLHLGGEPGRGGTEFRLCGEPAVALEPVCIEHANGGGAPVPCSADAQPDFRAMAEQFYNEVDGRDDDVIVDEFYAKQKKVHAGDHLKLINHDWRVAGVYESGKLARILSTPAGAESTGLQAVDPALLEAARLLVQLDVDGLARLDGAHRFPIEQQVEVGVGGAQQEHCRRRSGDQGR